MSKNWSLIIVVAFVMGYSAKLYLESQKQIEAERAQAAIEAMVADPVFNDKDNQPVHIFDPEDKRIRIAYFGYTRCPDVCPTSLAMLGGALNEFSDEQLANFWPMYITIDPERDDSARTTQYARYFHKSIDGFSAPMALTRALADKYGVIFKKTELPDSAIGYVVDHSSYFYFLEPDGTLITSIPHTLEPTPISDQMRKLLKERSL
ncbi:SCO family protein [Vibrio sp. JC009]|uniref:SCO family protein n=1 Tax=Vibrio sp. JC009 TaxID=2912314 RepID=UPI0023AECCB5|nr:SCO family protein [Vibrio sp. JC009]WED24906.1 SCO family protein [Vibrio sp. JC009]